jgi:hypothetical protein
LFSALFSLQNRFAPLEKGCYFSVKLGRNLGAKLALKAPKSACGEWKGNRINET